MTAIVGHENSDLDCVVVRVDVWVDLPVTVLVKVTNSVSVVVGVHVEVACRSPSSTALRAAKGVAVAVAVLLVEELAVVLGGWYESAVGAELERRVLGIRHRDGDAAEVARLAGLLELRDSHLHQTNNARHNGGGRCCLCGGGACTAIAVGTAVSIRVATLACTAANTSWTTLTGVGSCT